MSAKTNLNPIVFGQEYNEPLVHQVVVAYNAGARQGTKAQKSRSDVSGGGAKPFRQKGTGRARAGTIRSPIWVGGGKTFAATNRDHSQKVNKKMYRGAMRSILSELVRQDRFKIVDDIAPKAPKTKELVAKLNDLGVKDALIIIDNIDINLYLAARNIPNVYVVNAASVDPLSLIRFSQVIATAAAVKKIEEVLA